MNAPTRKKEKEEREQGVLFLRFWIEISDMCRI
jgi:hypothetical protein